MQNLDLYLKNLTAKDENKAIEVAKYLVDSADIELYKMLVEKSDFLFDFVRNNVSKRIEKVITKENYRNIIKFFNVYSVYYDDLFASILSKHANEDLTDEIFSLLEKGTVSQKAYSAKYFSYIPDTVAIELLGKYAFSDDESLSYNSAEALGQMQDDVSFDIALNTLASDDDFERLKAVKFFAAYGKNYPFEAIFKAVKSSKMPENIAGQIPYMDSLLNLLTSGYMKDTLIVFENIINGFGEILPLSDVFQFEMFEVLEFLINKNKSENEESGEIAKILLNALAKFNLFQENQEYVFDEDKDTKQELLSILDLLKAQNNEFWDSQKKFVIKELKKSDENIISVLPVISEFGLRDAVNDLVYLSNSDNEIVVCEVLNTLKTMNALENIDINSIVQRVQNPNIKAVIENIKA